MSVLEFNLNKMHSPFMVEFVEDLKKRILWREENGQTMFGDNYTIELAHHVYRVYQGNRDVTRNKNLIAAIYDALFPAYRLQLCRVLDLHAGDMFAARPHYMITDSVCRAIEIVDRNNLYKLIEPHYGTERGKIYTSILQRFGRMRNPRDSDIDDLYRTSLAMGFSEKVEFDRATNVEVLSEFIKQNFLCYNFEISPEQIEKFKLFQDDHYVFIDCDALNINKFVWVLRRL